MSVLQSKFDSKWYVSLRRSMASHVVFQCLPQLIALPSSTKHVLLSVGIFHCVPDPTRVNKLIDWCTAELFIWFYCLLNQYWKNVCNLKIQSCNLLVVDCYFVELQCGVLFTFSTYIYYIIDLAAFCNSLCACFFFFLVNRVNNNYYLWDCWTVGLHD